jgi:hypothetical protein
VYLLVIYLMTLSVAPTRELRMEGYVNDEWERMWKEAVMA